MLSRVVTALVLVALASTPAETRRSPGPTNGPYYRTVAPYEHFGADRTQVFPHTRTVSELAGSGPAEIAARVSPVDFTTPYIAFTRNRDQLFVYGYGPDAATQGGYVANVDPETLQERWRTQILDTSPAGQWSYPGVGLAHGNGYVYAIYTNILVKIHPRTGAILARLELPEDPNQTGAAYNGMIVMPDGRIVAKKIERGPCTNTTTPLAGLQCAMENGLPSLMVVVDPDRLRLLDTVDLGQVVLGRITWGRTGSRDYVYIAGQDTLTRYEYKRGKLTLDSGWGPVTYRTGAQQPGTGAGMLGEFLVVQTNFLPSTAPMTVTAVSTRDSSRVFQIQPFADLALPQSWIVSKAALDAENSTVVTHDTSGHHMAALRFDKRSGFSLDWRHVITSLNFSALTGSARNREIIISDFGSEGEAVVWLNLRTGEERARSGILADKPAPGNIVTPGFAGRFYYLSTEGQLVELRPRAL